jgi:hypothetical protein
MDLSVNGNAEYAGNSLAAGVAALTEEHTATATATATANNDSLEMIADDGDGTDFAAQLRKHRKQVLVKEQDSTNGFAKALRMHREHLVDAWVDDTTTPLEQQQLQHQTCDLHLHC